MENKEFREELEKLTVKTLVKDYATPLNITGRHDMKKAELIDAIIKAKEIKESNENKEDVPTKEEEKEIVKESTTKGLTEVQKVNKLRYVESAEIGTIVAFKLPGMKAKSAKITRKSTKNRKFKVETTYGTEFVISFEEVIWVKTNKRWPKGVYNLLKGIGEE